MSSSVDVKYPSNPAEWQTWLKANLGIDSKQGLSLVKEGTFPYDKLIDLWEEKFSSDNGYSPSFIPALTRNKIGFARWVYLDGPEPNWTKSDE